MSALIVATNLSLLNTYFANARNITEKGIYASIIIVLSKTIPGQNEQNVPISVIFRFLTITNLLSLIWGHTSITRVSMLPKMTAVKWFKHSFKHIDCSAYLYYQQWYRVVLQSLVIQSYSSYLCYQQRQQCNMHLYYAPAQFLLPT